MLQGLDVFETGQLLPTMYKTDTLAVDVQQVNNTRQVAIQSAGASGTIPTGPNYACNVSWLQESTLLGS